MSRLLNEEIRLFAPPYHETKRKGLVLLIDPEAPHWIVTDTRGADIIRLIDGRRDREEIITLYCKDQKMTWAKGSLHCQTFFLDALRTGFIATTPFVRAPYPGRSETLKINRLSELWLHLTNACNLSCAHCLVESSPTGISGGDTQFWFNTIDQAHALGTRRFFMTGGEPFLRSDIFDLISKILPESELIILTNAMLLKGEKLKQLAACDLNRLKLQVSLDGPTVETNDLIRGKGSFDVTLRGMKEAISLGFSPTLTTVVTRSNVAILPAMVNLAASLGIKNIHLLLSHHRGRALGSTPLSSPENAQLLEAFQKIKMRSEQAGIRFDNLDTLQAKLLGQSGVKVDLSNMAYTSLCVYADGQVYPSAALANIPSLQMGSLFSNSLDTIWKNAVVAHEIRKGSVQNKAKCKDCYLKYLCGGGDLEHAYLYTGSFMGEDPFSAFHEQLILETLFSFAEQRALRKTASGYDRPILFSAMGDTALADDAERGVQAIGGFSVSLSRSACVLSVDLEQSRRIVRDFYGQAATAPQPALCCPGGYPAEDTGHIPKEVLNIAYGCGSPMGLAAIESGETVIDLGSGGGIDCFIAAKKVGDKGRVVGIDMTDEMLLLAHQSKIAVAANLGYDVVEFKKGYLESIPLPDQFADLITSNCVVNLSPDKGMVFVEMWRVLKDFGRIVISDTVSASCLPSGMKANPRLWGECIAGALTEDAYLSDLERAGFYGLSVIKKSFWREVEGYQFYSVVIRGYKFAKKADCDYIGQRAIYLGPMQAVIDEEGHHFPRNLPVAVCTDTAAKLAAAPYAGLFVILEGDGEPAKIGVPAKEEVIGCSPGSCC